jgi:hypothetical protein
MEPFLFAEDKALIRPIEKLRVGDIGLVVIEEEGIALHRIIKDNGDTILIKGDYSGLVEYRKREDIVGIACAFKLRERDEWIVYTQSGLTRTINVMLSKGISRDDEVYHNAFLRRVCRKLMWRQGMRSRKKMVENR